MTSTNIRQRRMIWFLYIPVAAFLLYLWVQHAGNDPVAWLNYGLLILLAIFIAYFPIRTKDAVFALTSGVTLATFVIFGLIPEIFLSSLSILAVLVRSDVKWDQHYRYPLNLLATVILSAVSALAYYLTVEIFEIINFEFLGIIPLAAYMLVYIFGNQVLGFITEKYFYHIEEAEFFNGKLVFSIKTSLAILPLSFILIYLYYEMNTFGIIIGALPFIAISVVMKYYYNTKRNNLILMEVTKYSQKLATKSSRKEVIDSFINYILAIFPSEYIYYFRVTKSDFATMERVYQHNEPVRDPSMSIILTQESILMDVLKTQRIAAYDKSYEWRTNAYYIPFYKPESAIALPVQVEGINKGIIVITHPHQAIYDDFFISLIDIFYQYFRVVIDNVYQYEKLEGSNYTDYLTNLPNLRGFTHHFEMIANNENFDTLSSIVMDLDYFKNVNDVHGHEGGNEVLMQVADVLREFINEDCIVSRFGGEEFIVLLRNASKEEAYELAEDIRQAIENKVCTIRYSIQTDGTAEVRTTVSLGVATYPDDAETIHDLIKLADRAMYLGSKQNGRNRVTAHAIES